MKSNINSWNRWNQFLVTDYDSYVKKCFQTVYVKVKEVMIIYLFLFLNVTKVKSTYPWANNLSGELKDRLREWSDALLDEMY